MARKASPEKRQANLSTRQMQDAIPKIERRIADLDAFNVDRIAQRFDPSIQALSSKLDTLLLSIYGAATVEYDKAHWSVVTLDTAPMSTYEDDNMYEVLAGLRHGIARSRAALEAIKSGFEEELSDAGLGSVAKPLRAYEGLDLHSQIEKAAGQLFRDGHYANAIENAVKSLNALVRLNSGIDDRDGANLMEFVFSPKNPVLKFNALADQSDHDEQKGFMQMFAGAVAGLRNPRAHKIIQDDPERTLEFIAFVSLLAKLADSAKR